ncbi:SH3 domain-containing kinase-binding protein 1 isoform X1 [Tachysurus vachellii]|uniref:SH3 domain-containing kinase-binding protein 1 isoform X1 n=1 Tax=Tachysurus vachellii TaxID=175792 RepID=UPI00296B4D56|nr:SH3 domain-containing kinase-binding protein 1 isoform X1 [Tachysurus vachellii]
MVEAVVEFDYQAQHDDELTIAIGDIISNIRKDEGGWWEGEVDGRRGLFPDNFVREIKKEVKKELSSASQASKSDLSNGSPSPRSESSIRPAKKGEAIRKRRCKAAFSYIPQNEDELELKIGDVIEVLGEVEEGWWEGSLNGKIGMFPSNFTKELPIESEDLATPPEDTRSTRTSVKDSTGSESDGGDSSSVRSDAGSAASSSEIQPKKIRGFGFGDIFKDQPIKLRPRSMDLENELEKLPVKKPTLSVPQDTMKTEPENKPKAKEFCKVLFPYDAQNEDELSVKEGDIVSIISKDCADAGWWLGELNSKQGVFPDNFVKLFVPEVEKERPKKPPPPAAPSTKHTTDKKPEIKKVPPERPESLPQRVEEKGDDIKLVEVQQKPVLPVFPPKKPLPPKGNASMNRPSSVPPKRPERPAAPSIQSDSSGVASDRTSLDKPAETDIDEFDSIVSSTEKLSHPTASRPRVTDRRPRSQIFTSSSLPSNDLLDSLSTENEQKEREKGKDEPDSFPPKSLDSTRKMPKALPVITAPEKSSKPSTLTTAPGAVALRPHSPSMESKMKSEQGSTVMEELKIQLRELRATVELMKSQHKQEMKQLVSELDEEKKIRLSLQMDVENIKKVLSK